MMPLESLFLAAIAIIVLIAALFPVGALVCRVVSWRRHRAAPSAIDAYFALRRGSGRR